MARALGLPARIAVGLVYLRGAFYYHAWPEVFVDGGRAAAACWLPVDPTLNQFPADATHVRLARGGLDRQAAILAADRPREDRRSSSVELRPGARPRARRAARRRTCARSTSPLPQRDRRRAAAGRSPRGGAHDRGRDARQALRLVPRRRRREPRRGARRDPRLPRPERRRQDHDHPHDRGPAQAHGRPRSRSTATTSRARPRRPRRSLGFIPDRPVHLREADRRRVPALPRRPLRHATARPEARATRCSELFELTRWQDELVESFSHGMKQRLVMCAAFLHRPRAVLVDEPMVGLDPRGARLIKDVFRAHEPEGRRHPDEHAHPRGRAGDVRPHQHHPAAARSSRAAPWTSSAPWPAARTSSSRRCS